MTRYIHFTLLAPGDLERHRLCHTAAVGQNHYWLKSFSRAAYDAAFAAASPGDAARAIAASRYLLDCMRELLFESVRAEEWPHLPSRADCLFLADERADLDRCADRYGFGTGARTVLEIETDTAGTAFRGDAGLLDTSPIASDIVDAARRYWTGVSAEMPRDAVEILYSGTFRITGVRRWGTQPSIRIDGKGMGELYAWEPDGKPGSDPAPGGQDDRARRASLLCEAFSAGAAGT